MSTPEFDSWENPQDKKSKKIPADNAKILKDELEYNRKMLSAQIKKELSEFREEMEKRAAIEMRDALIPTFETNFETIKTQALHDFKSRHEFMIRNLYDTLKQTLDRAGTSLQAWEHLRTHYNSLWTKPFFIAFGAAILTGTATGLTLTYFMLADKGALHQQETELLAIYKNLYGLSLKEKDMLKKHKDKYLPSKDRA